MTKPATATKTATKNLWTKKVREQILEEVAEANGRRRVRTLDEDDVDAAIALRRKSSANHVRVWGGFVPNSYNKGFGTRCPVLRLDKDGSWAVYEGSCCRPHGRGERFTECTS